MSIDVLGETKVSIQIIKQLKKLKRGQAIRILNICLTYFKEALDD